MEVFLVRSDPQSRPTQVSSRSVFKTRKVFFKISLLAFDLTNFPLISQYRLVVPKLGTVTDLCCALSKLCGVAPENVSTSYI